jgi:hypothetical protein
MAPMAVRPPWAWIAPQMIEVVDTGSFVGSKAGRYRNVIARLSFEERSVILGELLAPYTPSDFLAFISHERSALAERNIATVQAKVKNFRQVELEIANPMETGRRLATGG